MWIFKIQRALLNSTAAQLASLRQALAESLDSVSLDHAAGDGKKQNARKHGHSTILIPLFR
jgi:hypothetical protein